jgi:hypothetical protein
MRTDVDRINLKLQTHRARHFAHEVAIAALNKAGSSTGTALTETSVDVLMNKDLTDASNIFPTVSASSGVAHSDGVLDYSALPLPSSAGLVWVSTGVGVGAYFVRFASFTVDTLTNKTINGVSNDVQAFGLIDAAGNVMNYRAAAAPVAGQVWTASSATTGSWTTPSAGGGGGGSIQLHRSGDGPSTFNTTEIPVALTALINSYTHADWTYDDSNASGVYNGAGGSFMLQVQLAMDSSSFEGHLNIYLDGVLYDVSNIGVHSGNKTSTFWISMTTGQTITMKVKMGGAVNTTAGLATGNHRIIITST